MKPTQT